MVCFCMLLHPCVPRVIALPQYWQVIIISPNLGAIGAPQLGHFIELTPLGATIDFCTGFVLAPSVAPLVVCSG